jgi:hypothetical protein
VKAVKFDLSKKYTKCEIGDLLAPYVGEMVVVMEGSRDKYNSRRGVYRFLYGMLGDDLSLHDKHGGAYSFSPSFFRSRKMEGVFSIDCLFMGAGRGIKYGRRKRRMQVRQKGRVFQEK